MRIGVRARSAHLSSERVQLLLVVPQVVHLRERGAAVRTCKRPLARVQKAAGRSLDKMGEGVHTCTCIHAQAHTHKHTEAHKSTRIKRTSSQARARAMQVCEHTHALS